MAKKKIFIIAGHGEGDPGACSTWGQEADFTRELAILIQSAIGTHAKVTMYDQTKNCYKQSKAGNVPSYSSYDFTIEVHFNAKKKKDPSGDGTFTGVGGYIHPNNKGRDIARKIIDQVVGLGFKEWLLADSTGLLNLNRAQTQNAKYFLLETAFIDDGDDMKFYNARKALFAQAIAQGILDGLGVSGAASEPTGADTTKDTYYRVRKSWEDARSQLFAGTKEGAIRACKTGYSVYDPEGNCIYTNNVSGLQATEFLCLSEAEFVEKVGSLYTADEKAHGIPACVSLAQAILESGYGKTDLAQAGNNLHGMKCELSGNSWAGSTWDGGSYYEKESPEVTGGVTKLVRSKFRSYENVEDSIADHAAYLLGAMKGTEKRYPGIDTEPDYRKVIQIIVKGGYATDPQYEAKLNDIISRFELTRFNASDSSEAVAKAQMIRITCKNVQLYVKEGYKFVYTAKTVAPGTYTLVNIVDGLGELKSGAGYIPVGCVEFC